MKKERQALAGSRPSALVYGDVDMNLLDGSAIWLQSVTQALVAAGCAVTLVLKAPVRTDRLVAPLRDLPEVTIRSPHAEGLLKHGASHVNAGLADNMLPYGDYFYLEALLRARQLDGTLAPVAEAPSLQTIDEYATASI